MSKAYRISKRTITLGERRGETVYNASPVSFGTLNSDDVAKQIAAESTASPGDVKNVLDRYAYFVAENLKKGYTIELLGFGYLSIRFRTKPGVATADEVSAKQVISLLPHFTPSFKMVNNRRIYDLIPENIPLVNFADIAVSVGGTTSDNASSDSGSSGSNSDSDDENHDNDLGENPLG